jgi:cyclopropane-fatty-acyl-phospholipid synthase
MEPLAVQVAERLPVPDVLLRAGIRNRVGRRIRAESAGGVDAQSERFRALVRRLDEQPIAVATADANAQHYEVPADFYALCLGPRRKYSCAWWPEGVTTLAEAEDAMLELYAERARLHDGQRVLDLGCGWGSLSLWLAERYPASRILGVSNSASQREYILGVARDRGFTNLEIVTADANGFEPGERFDRIVSIEMLEHVRNQRRMLARIGGWLRPDGLAFVHIFTHRTLPFEFDETRKSDWIARHFFTGGTMPSDDLMLHTAAGSLEIADHWRVSGVHYARTARAWLELLDANRGAAMEILGSAPYDRRGAARRFRRWRLFFLSCEGLWGYRGGSEFIVSHYLFRPVVSSA